MPGAADLAILIRVQDQARDALKQIERELGDVSKGADQASISWKAMGAATVAASAAAAAALAGLTVAAFKLGEQFDDAYDRIRITTGRTGESLAGLKDDFRAVVASVPASLGEVSEALAGLHQRLGLTGEPLQALTKQILQLSRLTGTDITNNVRLATRAFGDWSIGTENQADTLDFLFRASQKTGIGIQDLLGNLVLYGAPLRQFGVGFEEATALLARFELEGVNSDQIMQSMRLGLGRLAEKGIPLVEGLRDVIATVRDMESASEATSLAIDVFGARAGPDMAAAIREGRFAVDEIVTSLVNSGETIEQVTKDTDDARQTMTEAWNAILLALEPVTAAVFDLAGEAATNLAPVIRDEIVPNVREWAEATREVTGGIRDLKAAARDVPAIGGMFQLIGQNARNIQEGIRGMGSELGKLGRQLDEAGRETVKFSGGFRAPAFGETMDAEVLGGQIATAMEDAAEAAAPAVAAQGRLTGGRYNRALADAIAAKGGSGAGAATKTAIEGYLSTIAAAFEQADFAAQFGPLGGKALAALAEGIRNPQAEGGGAAAARAVGDIVLKMKEAGLPEAESLGEELRAAMLAGLVAGETEAIKPLLELVSSTLQWEAATLAIEKAIEATNVALEDTKIAIDLVNTRADEQINKLGEQRRRAQEIAAEHRVIAEAQRIETDELREQVAQAGVLLQRSRQDRDAGIQAGRQVADAEREHSQRLGEIQRSNTGQQLTAALQAENQRFTEQQKNAVLQATRAREDATRGRADQDADLAQAKAHAATFKALEDRYRDVREAAEQRVANETDREKIEDIRKQAREQTDNLQETLAKEMAKIDKTKAEELRKIGLVKRAADATFDEAIRDSDKVKEAWDDVLEDVIEIRRQFAGAGGTPAGAAPSSGAPSSGAALAASRVVASGVREGAKDLTKALKTVLAPSAAGGGRFPGAEVDTALGAFSRTFSAYIATAATARAETARFGQAGADLVHVLDRAMSQPGFLSGKTLGAAVVTLLDELYKSGVPRAAELGSNLIAAVTAAVDTGSPGAAKAARDAVVAIQKALTFSVDTFIDAFNISAAELALLQAAGPMGAKLVQAIKDGIKANTPEAAAAAAAAAQEIAVQLATRLRPETARLLLVDFMSSIAGAITAQTPASIAAVADVAARIRTALTVGLSTFVAADFNWGDFMAQIQSLIARVRETAPEIADALAAFVNDPVNAGRIRAALDLYKEMFRGTLATAVGHTQTFVENFTLLLIGASVRTGQSLDDAKTKAISLGGTVLPTTLDSGLSTTRGLVDGLTRAVEGTQAALLALSRMSLVPSITTTATPVTSTLGTAPYFPQYSGGALRVPDQYRTWMAGIQANGMQPFQVNGNWLAYYLGQQPAGAIPGYEHGGYIPRDTLAYLHRGEQVLPASGGTSGPGGLNITVNLTINGPVGIEDFRREVEQTVTDAVRRGGMAYFGIGR